MGILDWIIIACIAAGFVLSVIYTFKHKSCSCGSCRECEKSSCRKRVQKDEKNASYH